MSIRLRTLLDSLDDLPESIDPRALYVEGTGDYEGRYVVDLDAVDGLEVANTSALARSLDKERKGHKTNRSEVAKLQEALREAQEELDTLRESAGKGGSELLDREKAKFEKQLASAKQELQAQLEQLSAERDRYRDDYRQTHVRQLIGEAKKKAGIDFPDGVAQILANHARWEQDDDGSESLQVFDIDGRNPLLKAGQPAGFDELIRRYANDEQWQDVFRVPAQSGGDRRGVPAQPSRSGKRQYRASLDEFRDFATYEALERRAEAGEFELIPPTMGEG